MKRNLFTVLILFFGLIGVCRAAYAADALEALNKPTAKDFGATRTALDQPQEENIVQKHLNRLEKALASVGGFKITPFFEQGFRLTSNVFHDSKGWKGVGTNQTTRKMDTIWTETPGVGALYVKDDTIIDLSYKADFDNFTKFSQQNSQNQTAKGFVRLKPTKETYVSLQETFEQQELIAGAFNVKAVPVWQNDVNVKTGYQLGKFTPEFNYRNFIRRFGSDTENNFDYSQNEYALTGYYQWDERWKPFVSERLIQVDYTHNAKSRDALASDSRVGIQGLWPDMLFSINADAGAYVRGNRNTSSAAGNGPDFFVMSLFARKAIKNTLFETGFYRSPREATFLNAPIYLENAGYFGITQPLGKKLTARTNIILAKRQYNKAVTVNSFYAKRRDFSLSYGFGLIYNFTQQLQLQVDYKLERQESNFSDYDYTENSLITKLRFIL